MAEQEAPSDTCMHFATFFAINAAAIHLLEAIETLSPVTSYLPRSLIKTPDSIGYQLKLTLEDDACSLRRPGRWRLGSGWNRKTNNNPHDKGVDLILCPPDGPGAQQARKSIAPYHAEIAFHPESGVLFLRNIHSLPVLFEGPTGKVVLQKSDRYVFCTSRTRVAFGEYEFSLDFRDLGPNESSFHSLRDDIIIASGGHPLDGLVPVPPLPVVTVGNFWHHKSISEKWSTGVLVPNGQPVAVDGLTHGKGRRKRPDFATIERLSDAQGLLPILSISCQHGKIPPCKTSSKKPELMSCAVPLNAYTFRSMPWKHLKQQDVCFKFCHQTLIGLDSIHRVNLVHGRILPNDLWLLPNESARKPTDPSRDDETWGPWMLPMNAVVARWYYGFPRGRRWKDKIPPTIAPEIRDNSRETVHANKADIWSLGVSWMYMIYSHSLLDAVTEANHVRSLANKASSRNGGTLKRFVEEIVLPMLEIDPTARPETQELLRAAFWETVEATAETDAETRTRMVRIQSPPEETTRKKRRT